MNQDSRDYGSTDEQAEPTLELLTTCWRCRKTVVADIPHCPFCSAEIARPKHRVVIPQADHSLLMPMLIGFAILLSVNVGHTWLVRLQAEVNPGQAVQATSDEILLHSIVAEVVTTLVVLVCWMHVRPQPLRIDWRARVLTWPISLLMLAGALAFNVAYHHFLRDNLGVVMLEELLNDGHTPLAGWLVVICVQPAIVEELFFRHLVWGSLRTSLGGHAAVWLSSVMFAIAHIGTPLSLPVLMVLGVLLGYARWGSGGLALPMMLHFLHNLYVLLLDWT